MLRFTLLSFLVTFCTLSLSAQHVAIPQTNYTIQAFSSDNTNRPVADAIDADTTTFWALYNAAGTTFPGYIELDLGQSYAVSGISYLPNVAKHETRTDAYEIYVSTNGTTWGTAETKGNFPWAGNSDRARKRANFGAINARYIKVMYTSTTSNGTNIQTSDLVVYRDTNGVTGQQNQLITFAPIGNKATTDAPFAISATANSSLPLTYSVVSGPATISNGTVTLTGAAGTVILSAAQAGDATYYPASVTRSFTVMDLTGYEPTVTTRLTDSFDVEMPSLMAYPVYIKSSIGQPDYLSVTDVKLEVGGVQIPATQEDGYYLAYWTPSAYGMHNVKIIATGSNGNTKTLTRNMNVVSASADKTVSVFDSINITFNGTNSRQYIGTHALPQQVGAYKTLDARLIVQCPNTAAACDDWDRRAYIDIEGPDGNFVQIIRYMTPYKVACNHSIDLSDYASLLQGEFKVRIFIDTWGTGGWLMSLKLDYKAGAPDYNYSAVHELWDNYYFMGNPTDLQPVDTIDFAVPQNTEAAKIRLSTTGHGWGITKNTLNAAEFYNATNYVWVDGARTFTQNLWNNCNPNPDNCTGQQGTWQYSRAGWCPGTIAHPNIWSIDSASLQKSNLELIYQFDPTYKDDCHPSNPNCVDGQTITGVSSTTTYYCANCQDSYNPKYDVDGQVITFSNNPMGVISSVKKADQLTNTYSVDAFPNPASDFFNLQVGQLEEATTVEVTAINGQVMKTFYFEDAAAINTYNFNIKNLASGIYFIHVINESGKGIQKLIVD